MVTPTGKLSPGAAVLVTRLATPEISEAVGSVKKTGTLVVPSSTVRETLFVQITEGGVVSSVRRRRPKVHNVRLPLFKGR